MKKSVESPRIKSLVEAIENKLSQMSQFFPEVGARIEFMEYSDSICVQITPSKVITRLLKDDNFRQTMIDSGLISITKNEVRPDKHFVVTNFELKKKADKETALRLNEKDRAKRLHKTVKEKHGIVIGSVVELSESKWCYDDVYRYYHVVRKVKDMSFTSTSKRDEHPDAVVLTLVDDIGNESTSHITNVNLYDPDNYEKRHLLFMENNDEEIRVGSKFVFKSSPKEPLMIYQKIETFAEPTKYTYRFDLSTSEIKSLDNVWFFE